MSNFEDVKSLYKMFGFPVADYPQLIDYQTIADKIDHMDEEIREILEGLQERNLSKVADGLIDLTYLAMGLGAMMGLPWEKLFAEVHRANACKQAVQSPAESVRGHALDLMKPDGWKPPNIAKILNDDLAEFMQGTRADMGRKETAAESKKT